MSTTTLKLGLIKPVMDDIMDQTITDLGTNADKIEKLFTPGDAAAHKHDGVDSEKISHTSLKDLATGDPHTQYVLKTLMGAAGGVASLAADGKIPAAQLPSMNYIPTSDKGAVNGVATIGADGKLVQDAKTVLGVAPNTGTVANTIPVRDANGKLPGSITGDAGFVAGRQPGVGVDNLAYYDANNRVADSAKLEGKTTGNVNGGIPVYDANVRVFDSNKLGGLVLGTVAGTVTFYDGSGRVADSVKLGGSVPSAAATANTIPVRDSTGKVVGSITGDAATVGGIDASAFARVTGQNFTGAVSVDGGGGVFSLKPGTADHAYLQFYARTATPGVRSGYVGYSGPTATSLDTVNQLTNGHINFITAGTGQVQANGAKIAVYDGNSRVLDSVKVGGVWVRNNGGVPQWSMDNATWSSFGSSNAQVRRIARIYG